jgi:undecaprenyl-diphosphatase
VDYFLFTIINGVAVSHSIVGGIAILCAVYLIFLLPCGVLFLDKKKWKPASMALFASASIAYGIYALIGLLSMRSRPFVAHDVIQLIYTNGYQSFPSAHTAIAWAIAIALFFFHARIGYVACVLAFLIGLSRIAVGVHYPFDVFAGMVVGIGSAYVARRFFFQHV